MAKHFHNQLCPVMFPQVSLSQDVSILHCYKDLRGKKKKKVLNKYGNVNKLFKLLSSLLSTNLK